MTHSKHDTVVIDTLVAALTKGQAHVTFEAALKGLSPELRGVKPANMPYSIWQLVDHIRITQWDILEFSMNPAYRSLTWPDDYWPKEASPSSEKVWKDCLKKIEQDRDAFTALLQKPGADLYTPFPHGDGQNLLREAILLVDHTSYHTGEIVAVRRMLGAWGR